MRITHVHQLSFPIAAALTLMLLWGPFRSACDNAAEPASWLESVKAEGEPDDLDDLDVVIGDGEAPSLTSLVSELGIVGHKKLTPVCTWRWSTRGPPRHA